MNFTKTQTKDILWHSAKALLCALQLWLLDAVAKNSAASLLEFLLREHIIVDKQAPWLSLVRPVVVLLLFFALWWYYDSIDDRSFLRFCEAPETPHTLRDAGFLSGVVVTVLTTTPILTASLCIPFVHLGLRLGEAIAVSALLSAVITGGASLLRIKNLGDTWAIQKTLRTGNEKMPGVIKRIIYAVIYFFALNLLVSIVLSALIPIWGAFLIALGKLLLIPVLVIACILFLWLGVFNCLRQLNSRRKFMRRLRRLRDKGELSFAVHGHPYLSVFSTRIFFGLTIVDSPHPDGKKRTDTTYQVAFANCKRRRFTVVLCDQNVYRFVYTLQFNQISRYSRMGAAVGNGGRIISVPGASWYRNHAFGFPEGEGERILLVDPTPYILAIHGQRAGELQELDNDSKVFGYTVYGKNSFLNLLERT